MNGNQGQSRPVIRTGEIGLAAWTRDLAAARGLVRLEIEACSEFIPRAIAKTKRRETRRGETKQDLRGQVSDDAYTLQQAGLTAGIAQAATVAISAPDGGGGGATVGALEGGALGLLLRAGAAGWTRALCCRARRALGLLLVLAGGGLGLHVWR